MNTMHNFQLGWLLKFNTPCQSSAHKNIQMAGPHSKLLGYWATKVKPRSGIYKAVARCQVTEWAVSSGERTCIKKAVACCTSGTRRSEKLFRKRRGERHNWEIDNADTDGRCVQSEAELGWATFPLEKLSPTSLHMTALVHRVSIYFVSLQTKNWFAIGSRFMKCPVKFVSDLSLGFKTTLHCYHIMWYTH